MRRYSFNNSILYQRNNFDITTLPTLPTLHILVNEKASTKEQRFQNIIPILESFVPMVISDNNLEFSYF